MTPTNNLLRPVRRLVIIATIIILAACIYSVVYGVQTLHSTGRLIVHTPGAKAVITISGNSTAAEVIGTGEAHIRIRPGTYLLGASLKGGRTTQRVVVTQGGTTETTINVSEASSSATPNTPRFDDFDSLADYGFTAVQSKNLKYLFAVFAPRAQSIAVDAATITIGKYDPNDPNPHAPILFDVRIDGRAYHASVVANDDLTNVTLTILDAQTGEQLFQKSTYA